MTDRPGESLSKYLRQVAEDPHRSLELRRALIAFVRAPDKGTMRAGLLQLASEFEKIEAEITGQENGASE